MSDRVEKAPVPFTRQTLVRAPPKAVFQLLADVTMLEEISNWKVHPDGDEVGEGFTWSERKLWQRRRWEMTQFDRRGLNYTMQGNGITVVVAAKKGGTGSCNVRMMVEGDDRAVRRFERTDGDRLERLAAYLEA